MKKILKDRIRNSKGVFLFLDFDGTVSKIVSRPGSAKFFPPAKQLIKSFQNREDVMVSIVTGRSLKDVRKKVGLKNVVYAANHGMEIYYNGRYLLKKGEKYKRPLNSLGKEIKRSLRKIPGTVVENKGYSIAVHFRAVKKSRHREVRDVVKELARPYLKKYRLQMTTGKMVYEIRPQNFWNKGKAVKWIWKRLAPDFLPCYCGDDITDEDAFKSLKKSGVTIRVGTKKGSVAKTSVRSVEDLVKLLKKVI